MLLTSITKGVNFSVRGILLSLCFLSSKLVWQSFLSLLRPLQSSLALSLSFGMLSSLIAARASSAFIYFWAFSSILAIVFGGLFVRTVTNSLNFNLALKVINYTLSSTSTTSRTSLVKHFTCDLRGSLSPCLMVSRWFTGLFWCYLPTKWHTKELPSCSKFSMDDIASLLNHTHAAPLKVVWKEQQDFIWGLLKTQSHLEGGDMVQWTFQAIKWFELRKTKLWRKRTLQDFCSEGWISPSDHPV